MGPSYCDVIRGQATRLPMGPGHPPPIGILHVVSNVGFSFPSAAARLNELRGPQVNKAGGSAGARRNGICGDGVTRDGGIGSRTGTGRRESAASQSRPSVRRTTGCWRACASRAGGIFPSRTHCGVIFCCLLSSRLLFLFPLPPFSLPPKSKER
ncbi:hypothetical protein BHM03_00001508 [Ensete ventricosum]|uniref:Uncharacterized protein n=1 Tax=Ensete ventricosum TaxID=4639 RepID=A0A445M966_ENSVE|nr:hypothetical protein BHM03_00001508 [Ensete ventricosum]